MKACVVAFGCLLIGCGGGTDGSTGGGGDTTAFLGSWSTPTATTTYSGCANPPATVTQSVSFTVSADGSGKISTNISNCPLSFKVSGEIATVIGPQQCGSETVTIGSTTYMTLLTVSSGMLTLSAGSLVYSGNGSSTTTNNGVGQTCNFEESGTFTKPAGS
jgi:hypothetical protein